MLCRIGIIFVFWACIYSHQLYASSYKYIQQPHIGGNIGKNLTVVDNRLYILSKSEWYAYGSYLDIYQLDTAEPAKQRRRIQLNSETRRMEVSKDLVLLEHLDSVSVMRITETSAQLIGTIKVSYPHNFQATLHNNLVAIRNGFNAGATDIEIYEVGDQISLRKKLTYNSGGLSGQLKMDSDSIYLRDTKYQSQQRTIYTIDLKNYEINNSDIPYNHIFTYIGNGHFISNDLFNKNEIYIHSNSNNKVVRKFSLPIPIENITAFYEGKAIEYRATTQSFCELDLRGSTATDKGCTNAAPDIKQANNLFATSNHFIYFDKKNYYIKDRTTGVQKEFPAPPHIFQYGFIGNNLITLTDDGYYRVHDDGQSIVKLEADVALNNATDIRIPLQFTEDAITRYRLESTNKMHVEKHVLESNKMTLRESYRIPSDRRYEDRYFLASEKYYIELTDTMDVYDTKDKTGVINSLTKDQLTASNNFTIQGGSASAGQKLHNNIAFYKGYAELYYLNILSKEQHPLSLIKNVHSFDTENQNLLIAYENTIRFYQIKDDKYSEMFNYSSNECTGSTPIGVSLNNNKAIILKQSSSKEILQHRNFLCVYDISGGNAKFETKLEIPSAATGQSKFTIKGKDLYGVIGNDGRLFHYQQNFAPTFPASVTMQEDSHLSPLVTLSDVENDALTLQITKPASQGSASIVGNQISYAPKTNYYGNDVIGVKVTDAVGNVTEQDINITITPVNDLPVIETLQFTVNQNEKYSGQVKATDVEGDKLSFTVLTQPKLGLLTLNNDGSFSYQPSQSGDDNFEVKVSDGNGGESKTQVSIKVNASTSTGGATTQPTNTESSSGGSTGFFSLTLLSALAWRRRQVN